MAPSFWSFGMVGLIWSVLAFWLCVYFGGTWNELSFLVFWLRDEVALRVSPAGQTTEPFCVKKSRKTFYINPSFTNHLKDIVLKSRWMILRFKSVSLFLLMYLSWRNRSAECREKRTTCSHVWRRTRRTWTSWWRSTRRLWPRFLTVCFLAFLMFDLLGYICRIKWPCVFLIVVNEGLGSDQRPAGSSGGGCKGEAGASR